MKCRSQHKGKTEELLKKIHLKGHPAGTLNRSSPKFNGDIPSYFTSPLETMTCDMYGSERVKPECGGVGGQRVDNLGDSG